MRIEAAPIGTDRASAPAIIAFAINLFSALKRIDYNGLIRCSYRQIGVRECQPDISYHLSHNSTTTPRSFEPVDLNRSQPPDLVIEIANTTTLPDHISHKRMLYEELGIAEYWVVDIVNAHIVPFGIIAPRGSKRITQTQVFPAFAFSLLEEVLQRDRHQNHTQIRAWLLTQFQQ